MLVEVLNTWPVITGTKKEEKQWKGEEWNMEGKDLRATLNRLNI